MPASRLMTNDRAVRNMTASNQHAELPGAREKTRRTPRVKRLLERDVDPLNASAVDGQMSRAKSWRGVRIYTVGHSTRTLDEFVALLRPFDISVLVDIRTIPRSRHNPQFNSDSLLAALRPRGLHYVHLPRLGGLRRARKDSP